MKRTKLMLGTMILGLGMAGAAWAQPAPDHDRNAKVYSGYTHDRDDVNRARGDRDDRSAWRGDGDRDRDDNYGVWNARGHRDDRNVWRSDRDARGSWNWGHSDMRRNDRDRR